MRPFLSSIVLSLSLPLEEVEVLAGIVSGFIFVFSHIILSGITKLYDFGLYIWLFDLALILLGYCLYFSFALIQPLLDFLRIWWTKTGNPSDLDLQPAFFENFTSRAQGHSVKATWIIYMSLEALVQLHMREMFRGALPWIATICVEVSRHQSRATTKMNRTKANQRNAICLSLAF